MRRPARRLRTALAALAVAGTLAGCGAFGDAPSQGGEPRPEGQAIRVGLPTGVTSFANADLAVAIEKGFLSEAGLTAAAQTAADLPGGRVGVQEVGAFREVMTRLVLQSAGLTPNDVQYIPVDAQSYTSALVDGRIQNAILQTEQAVAATRDHPGMHAIAELADIVPDYHY